VIMTGRTSITQVKPDCTAHHCQMKEAAKMHSRFFQKLHLAPKSKARTKGQLHQDDDIACS
jgi:hypothetical protein